MRPIIIICAEYVYLLVVLGWLIALWKMPSALRKQFIVCTIIAGLLAAVFAIIASHLHYEPRPFVARHVIPVVAHGTDNGFPSDHALLTMTLTAVTFFFTRKVAFGMFIATVLVGIGRVAALLHSPQQIAAGWILATMATILAYYAQQSLLKPKAK